MLQCIFMSIVGSQKMKEADLHVTIHSGAAPALKKWGGTVVRLWPEGIPNNFYIVFA